jgi:hypothetical protein
MNPPLSHYQNGSHFLNLLGSRDRCLAGRGRGQRAGGRAFLWTHWTGSRLAEVPRGWWGAGGNDMVLEW